jgi:hypothetical protein
MAADHRGRAPLCEVPEEDRSRTTDHPPDTAIRLNESRPSRTAGGEAACESEAAEGRGRAAPHRGHGPTALRRGCDDSRTRDELGLEPRPLRRALPTQSAGCRGPASHLRRSGSARVKSSIPTRLRPPGAELAYAVADVRDAAPRSPRSAAAAALPRQDRRRVGCRCAGTPERARSGSRRRARQSDIAGRWRRHPRATRLCPRRRPVPAPVPTRVVVPVR